ncbi:MAG: membrane lipoprotein lipid attachment site-containing protein [Acinetobacter sp.]
MKKTIVALFGVVLLSGCEDSNSKPTYGESGLPKNCRAIVQNAIDEWRKGNYSTEDTMSSLERNCGANGYSWESD